MIKLSQEEINTLHCKSGSRQEFYKAELLDRQGIKKADLKLLGGNIDMNMDVDIKRAGRIQFAKNDKVNYITDKVKIYMGIMIGKTLKWYSLGVFLFVKPSENGGTVVCQVYDETIMVQQARIDGVKIFLQGTLYTDVLRYLLISLGFTKLNIQSSNLTLPTDIVLDGNKNNLEWFNYIAEQINFTQLTVDSNGWFVSKKYIEPSPSSVGYVYESNQMSVLVGEKQVTMDSWQIPNVITRIVSHPQLGEMVATYINDDPTDDYSVRNRGKISDRKTIDNIASQVELDNLVRKLGFNAKQVAQEVTFTTLNMPMHEVGDILELKHTDLKGVFVEHGWNIDLVAGGNMTHTVKRLVRLND